MRIYYIFTCLLLIFFSNTNSQGYRAQDNDPYHIAAVREALWEQSKGITDSSTEKNINRLGDKAAIALLKILKEDELQDPQTIRSTLPIIHRAFAYPKLISEADDRKPSVTLFLLHHLESQVTDPTLKAEISELIKFIKDNTATITQVNGK